MKQRPNYDCIIIGAGPGGLQAAIHLARYNRRVLIIDRGGGRTTHAGHIVNYLGIPQVSGQELVAIGIEQVRSFDVEIIKDTVLKVEKTDVFEVQTVNGSFPGRFVLVSTGAVDHLPKLKNLDRFFGKGFYTCIDCDGHLTTGKKLLVMGNSINAVRLALGMKEMYTSDVSLLLTDYVLPAGYSEVIDEEHIPVYSGSPSVLLGEDQLEGVELEDNSRIRCQAVMASYGWHLNDSFLKALELERDSENFKILTGNNNETSMNGLYVTGALKTGHSQAIIAAGQGAIAAIDINQRLLEL